MVEVALDDAAQEDAVEIEFEMHLEADRRDVAWGLSLPAEELPMGQGDQHRQRGLERLALWSA